MVDEQSAAGLKTLDPHGARIERELYRIGGIAGIGGGILAIVGNALHPRLDPDDLGDIEKTLAMVADFELWGLVHLGLIVGILLGLLALVAIAKSVMDGRPAAWSRVALATALVSGAVAAVSFSIDGVVMARLAHEWANAGGGDRATVVAQAESLIHVDLAVFSVAVIGVFGATQGLFGITLLLSRSYPRWLGVVAVAGGAIGFVSGAWIWLSGETGVGNYLVLFTLSGALLAVWLVGASVRLLRLGRGGPH